MGFSERFSFGVQKKAILENQYKRFCVFRHNILIFISLELSFCIQQLVKLLIDGDPIVINTFFWAGRPWIIRFWNPKGQ